MWSILAGAGVVVLLLRDLFKGESKPEKELKKRIFISFSIKDEQYRDHLVEQAKKERTPFSFVDMSVKKPWKQEEWKKRCRTKIKTCDGMIVLLSKNTYHASGQRWEMKCAKEEGLPIIGMQIKKNDQGAIPPELRGQSITTWTWDNLESAIKKIKK